MLWDKLMRVHQKTQVAPTLETETKGSWFGQHVIRVNSEEESH